MHKIKIILLCITILAIILSSFTFLEFFILKLLGLQYESTFSLVIFFILYLILQIPLLVLSNAIPKAFKSADVLASSNGLFTFSLYFMITFLFIILLDKIMQDIEIARQSVAIFAFISSFINMKMRMNPPSVESEEFLKLNDRFKS